MYLVGGGRANQSAPGLLGKDRAKARGAESRSDIRQQREQEQSCASDDGKDFDSLNPSHLSSGAPLIPQSLRVFLPSISFVQDRILPLWPSIALFIHRLPTTSGHDVTYK